jgi:CubicO group peptidase (beta-lactamase class C family)
MRLSSGHTSGPCRWRSAVITLGRVFHPALLAALAILAVAAPVAAQFTPFEAAVAEFDAEVAAGVAEDAAGCVSVAVFIAEDVIWSKGYGWADIENRVACTENSIGRTGSISKSFTAVLMMQLVERGLIDLDDPVADYLPELRELADPPAGMRPITFRMLASHTAGLVREPRLEGAASGSIYRWEAKVLESIPYTGFNTPPGTEYSYSNIGYGILGLALSRAAGVPFMTLVEELIFRPLGMTSSTYIVNTPDLAARLSVGYSRDRETGEVSAEQATREHLGRGYKVPNGGIYSTVGDLEKFAAAMLGASPVRILSAESLAEVFTPQPPADGYGLGFSVRDEDGMTLVGHGGSVAGYNAHLLFELDSKIGVAVLRTTSYNPPVEDLLRELVAASRGK